MGTCVCSSKVATFSKPALKKSLTEAIEKNQLVKIRGLTSSNLISIDEPILIIQGVRTK
jgi:hypothetical protein